MTAATAEAATDLLATDGETPAAQPGDRDRRQLMIALAAAVALHVLPFVGTVAWTLVGGGSSQSRVEIGDPLGKETGVNVEVIDAAEFDRRYVSFGKGRDAADSEATPASRPSPQSSPPPAQPSEPAEQQTAAAEPVVPLRETGETADTQPQKRAEPQRAERPPAPPRSPAQPFSQAEIDALVSDSKAELAGEIMLTSMASGARLGEVSAYVRGVMRKLKATMPKSNGIRGNVVVGIILGDTGEVAWVGVLKSSGQAALDRLVIERVRTTKFDAPAPNAPERERRFQVTYAYN
jgi:TonB family protein